MNTTQKRHTSSNITVKKLILVFSFLTLIMLILAACGSPESSEPATDTTISEQAEYAGKKIVWVDSYHQGYAWSDGIESGVMETLADTGAEVKVIRMDTKRNTDTAFGEQAAMDAKTEIEAFEPDVVIACDDNAQTYLVAPYLKDTDLPVVFCGVNWDASPYGYPTDNVTGMVEIDLVQQMVDLLKPYAEGESIAYLTGDSNTEHKVFDTYNERFFDGQLQPAFVKDFEAFKSEYSRLQDEVDIVYFGNNAGIEGWDDAAAEAFILENTKVPSGSSSDWMSPFTMLIVGKSAVEQGEWAAETALSIIDDTSVSDIPITENKESTLIINLNLADKLGLVIEPSVLRHAEVYGE